MSKRVSVRSESRNVLPDEVLRLIATRFKALSEPIRLKLIMALEGGERNVSELVEESGATQANVSRHLAVLAACGVISRRKEGVSVYYRISDPAIFKLCDHVCGSIQRDLQQQVKSVQLLPRR